MAYRKFNNDKAYGEKPVKEGETYDITIEGIGSKGDGIGKIQGFVIIVPGVKKGDNVKVKVNAVRGKVGFAEVVGEGTPKAETEKSEETESESEESEDSEESEETESTETEEAEAEESEESTEAEEEPEEEF